MSAVTPTPGQALYAVISERFIDDDDIVGWSEWGELDDSAREVYEDAARAAMAAAANGLLAAAGVSLDEVAAAVTDSVDAYRERPAAAPELVAAVDALTKVTRAHERVMFAAGIDIRRGQPGAARVLLGEQLGGSDGMPPWDGTETGAQYLERTGGES